MKARASRWLRVTLYPALLRDAARMVIGSLLLFGVAQAQDTIKGDLTTVSKTMVVQFGNTEFSCLPSEITVMRPDFKVGCAAEVHEMQWHPPGKMPIKSDEK